MSTFEQFADDEVLQAAVERKLEIIGEALSRAERAQADLAEAVPQLRKVIGLRNVLAHAYDTVNVQVIYATVMRDVPVLVETLRRILAAG